MILQCVVEILKGLSAPWTRLPSDEIREPRVSRIFDRIEQFEGALVELVQGVDTLLAVDDLESLASEPSCRLLDVMEVRVRANTRN